MGHFGHLLHLPLFRSQVTRTLTAITLCNVEDLGLQAEEAIRHVNFCNLTKLKLKGHTLPNTLLQNLATKLSRESSFLQELRILPFKGVFEGVNLNTPEAIDALLTAVPGLEILIVDAWTDPLVNATGIAQHGKTLKVFRSRPR